MSNSAPAISGTGHIIFNDQGYFGAQSFSGQITFQSASGLGLNFSTFSSGNTGNFVAANSGVFGPVAFFYVQAAAEQHTRLLSLILRTLSKSREGL